MDYVDIHPNQSAFPSPEMTTLGLTKREYFAGLALQGIAAAGFHPAFWDDDDEWLIAGKAVAIADALIKELSGDE